MVLVQKWVEAKKLALSVCCGTGRPCATVGRLGTWHWMQADNAKDAIYAGAGADRLASILHTRAAMVTLFQFPV